MSLKQPEPSLPAIDRARLASVGGGDAEFERELLDAFVEDARTHAAAIAAAVSRDDRDAARRAVHAVKGSARNVGAPRVAALAAALEQAVLDGTATVEDPPLLSAEIERFAAEAAG